MSGNDDRVGVQPGELILWLDSSGRPTLRKREVGLRFNSLAEATRAADERLMRTRPSIALGRGLDGIDLASWLKRRAGKSSRAAEARRRPPPR